MPRVDVVVESPAATSARAMQLEGLFDVPPRQSQRLSWSADIPIENDDWCIGLIVGPSGCGKTTIARSLWPDALTRRYSWNDGPVVDGFPAGMSVQEIADLCSAVGFNTIPAWLRPYRVLSNGEQFRIGLARALSEAVVDDVIVFDEFTSVVDRQVAQIGSLAVAKIIRRRKRHKFVAVTCHYDIIDWLDPDWIFEPADGSFTRRSLRCRRPSIDVEMGKVKHDFWRLFAPYHYMTANLATSAQCYVLFVGEHPAVFVGLLHRPHAKSRNVWGVSRVVTLPDYQGLGLAFVLMDRLAGAMKALGQRMRMYPAHPALIRSFDRSPRWSLRKQPGLVNNVSTGSIKGGGRPNATFEYVGESWDDRDEAARFLAISSLMRQSSLKSV